MRFAPSLLPCLLLALAACDRKTDFDASYNDQAANLSAQANAMQRDLARQMEAATAATAIGNGASNVGANVVVHAQ